MVHLFGVYFCFFLEVWLVEYVTYVLCILFFPFGVFLTLSLLCSPPCLPQVRGGVTTAVGAEAAGAAAAVAPVAVPAASVAVPAAPAAVLVAAAVMMLKPSTDEKRWITEAKYG